MCLCKPQNVGLKRTEFEIFVSWPTFLFEDIFVPPLFRIRLTLTHFRVRLHKLVPNGSHSQAAKFLFRGHPSLRIVGYDSREGTGSKQSKLVKLGTHSFGYLHFELAHAFNI